MYSYASMCRLYPEDLRPGKFPQSQPLLPPTHDIIILFAWITINNKSNSLHCFTILHLYKVGWSQHFSQNNLQEHPHTIPFSSYPILFLFLVLALCFIRRRYMQYPLLNLNNKYIQIYLVYSFGFVSSKNKIPLSAL